MTTGRRRSELGGRGLGARSRLALAMGTASVSMASTFACGGADTPALRATDAGDAGSSGTLTVDANSAGADSSTPGAPPPSGGSAAAAAGSHGSADAGAETSASGADGSGAASIPPPPDGAVRDATTTANAGPRAIVCGHLACDPRTQVCCLADRGPVSCTATSACVGRALPCSGSESCSAGDVCCGKAADGGALDFACAASCGPDDTRICSTDADCPNGRCQSRESGYGSCIPQSDHDAASN